MALSAQLFPSRLIEGQTTKNGQIMCLIWPLCWMYLVSFQAAGIVPLHFLPLTYVTNVVVIVVIIIVVVHYRLWKVMVTYTVFHLCENFRSQKLKVMEVPYLLEVLHCKYLKKNKYNSSLSMRKKLEFRCMLYYFQWGIPDVLHYLPMLVVTQDPWPW